ncbi:hypothetical protein INR49_023824 [Caranx melampygus]|nr:hypothetical protein INR49_023824 [Caranx melampygus]
MDAIFHLLEMHRLERYYNHFLQLGVKDERDFLDSVTEEDLTSLGLTQVEKNRYSTLKKTIGRFRAPAQPAATLVQNSVKSFFLQYTYPKCPEVRCIRDMDPSQNTVEDLMLRICHLESVPSSKGVCLYTLDGMPLTDDPFLNTCKGAFEVNVDLHKDTIAHLRNKLANESGIPAHVLHYKGESGTGNTLESCGISEGSTLLFSLSSFSEEIPALTDFFYDDVKPSVQQTPKGISSLLSSLYIIKVRCPVVPHKRLIGFIRKLTGCNPLAQSLYQLLCKNEIISRTQKIAVVEGLYTLFRELLPKHEKDHGIKIIEDLDIFEYSTYCWAHLMSEAKKETSDHENYAPCSLLSEEGKRFLEPVNVPGVPGALERAVVLQKIQDNLGVYLNKNKAVPAMIHVYNCLSGNTECVDVNVLAAQTGDHRDDHSFVTTRTPKEAILVLIDTSSSMTEKCYGSVEMQKIHAVKELFDNFATRSMAYDFHHVIGLVTFSSTVKTLHTFTETLEKFKEHVHTLQAAGHTKLYDALQHGMLELEKVKREFPDCRLRILCLTDGYDIGSTNQPASVAVSLINSNIILDSILLGDVQDSCLHGISIATVTFRLLNFEHKESEGGCCFKPQTSKDGLKLFEIETVLSLEMRKPKNKADPSSITERIHEAKDGRFMEKDRRVLEELKSLHCDPHPYCNVFPCESDFSFWKILMEGPPESPYEKGVFELFCQFGSDYPVKPPTVRFVTRIYHCNINSVGRICHNIFDRNYNAQITMRDILDAVYGLLIVPEPEDPLDRHRYDPVAGPGTLLRRTDLKPYRDMKKMVTEFRLHQLLEANV